MPTPIHPVYHPLYQNDDKFIVLVTGGRGCEDPNTKVIMHDLTIKLLKDIKVGDKVMGDDFTPRTVLNTVQGRSDMYWVRQENAEDYKVNAEHILTVRNGDDIRDINVLDFADAPQEFRDRLLGYKVVGRINQDIHWTPSKLTIEPAGIGDWCGIVLDGNHRYLHSDGTVTHNSGKSFETSRFIERLTFERGHKILFSRYTMTSADKSIIPEVKAKIDSDGTAEYFDTAKDRIINNRTKSEIIFMGIKTSSGNQTAKMKSIQGLSTFVVDEAEEWVSSEEYEKLVLSIRQKGVKNTVIIVMNPSDTSHFVYQKYIKDTHKLVDFLGVPVQISTHPKVLHIHTTYMDNLEYLTDEFISEVEDMQVNNPEKFAKTVAGQWSELRTGLIFPHYEVVDSIPPYVKQVGIGLDFGYTADPSAGVRCGVHGNDLYIDELFYRRGMGYEELANSLMPYDCPVFADSSEPREIDEIENISKERGRRVNIYAVKKGAGSIITGIQKMQDMNLKVTRRSMNAKYEFDNYCWEVDRFGKVINKPVDKDNHIIDAVRYYVLAQLLGQRKRERQCWDGI